MLAGLPKYQEGKEAYSLHLTMTQDAMNVFQERRLADVASVEQVSNKIWPDYDSGANSSSHWQQTWTRMGKSQKTWQIKLYDYWMTMQ